MFEGRRLLIATKHKKEQVIAPILEEGLGVQCFVPENYDSDIFGTFSGEIDRKDTLCSYGFQCCIFSLYFT